MDASGFDGLVRFLATRIPRRTAAGLLGLSALGVTGVADARKNKKKIKRNDFGCVDVGKTCKNNGQCCSGICKGNKDKKTCKAHDQSTCQKGEDVCLGVEVECTTTTGAEGRCYTSTGNASYCAARGGGNCAVCSKDADCVPAYGEGAACVVCEFQCADVTPQGTACLAPGRLLNPA